MNWWAFFDLTNLLIICVGVPYVMWDHRLYAKRRDREQALVVNTAYSNGLFDGKAIWRNEDELRLALRNLKAVQAGWAFGVPEDGREQWLDMVIETVRR